MARVEEHNPELKGVLPRGCNLLPNATLVELLRLLAAVDLAGDAFGQVYEYFLGYFALKEGQKGGMFVHSAAFVQRHRRNATSELTLFGTEKAADKVKLAKMNLAVHGLSGDIREANTY
jgi:type I restriction enzyme M protein